MKSVTFCLLVVMACTFTLLASTISAAPRNHLMVRDVQYGASPPTLGQPLLNLQIKLSAETCQQIASSLKPIKIGEIDLTIYDHVCVETCLYLHQVYAVEHLEVRLHVAGTFHGKAFSLNVAETVDIQVILNNGCAVVTERKKLVIDLQTLRYEELIAICEKLQITIDREQCTTKEQVLAFIGFQTY